MNFYTFFYLYICCCWESQNNRCVVFYCNLINLHGSTIGKGVWSCETWNAQWTQNATLEMITSSAMICCFQVKFISCYVQSSDHQVDEPLRALLSVSLSTGSAMLWWKKNQRKRPAEMEKLKGEWGTTEQQLNLVTSQRIVMFRALNHSKHCWLQVSNVQSGSELWLLFSTIFRNTSSTTAGLCLRLSPKYLD